MKEKKVSQPAVSTYRLGFVVTPDLRTVLDTLKSRTGRQTWAEVLRDSLRAWLWVTEVLRRGNDVVEVNPYATKADQIKSRFGLMRSPGRAVTKKGRA